jgi:hypothetical protein
MKTHSPDKAAKLTPNEARAGRRVKGMPVVLGLSIAAAIAVGLISLVAFAS